MTDLDTVFSSLSFDRNSGEPREGKAPYADRLPRQNEYEEKERTRQIAAYRAQRFEAAKRRIPLDFHEPFDRNRTGIDLKSMDSIMAWDGKRSILAKGMSQLGKTRSVYKLLMKWHTEYDSSFIVLDERKILGKVTDAFGEKGLQKLDRKLCNVDILFLDDLDKVNFTNGVMAQNALTLIFGVIKDRMANRRPTFITMNTSVTEVFQSAGPAVTQSLIERMKQPECWQVEVFNQPTNQQ
tara:strand:- start:1135 stop:1851 length:717 start_codon:yes stop_codon:yes gene_type:complete